MAAYVYYLADIGSAEVGELVRTENEYFLRVLKRQKGSRVEAEYTRDAHSRSVQRLTRWLWGGGRSEVMGAIAEGKRQIAAASEDISPTKRPRRPAEARLVPQRTAVLSPTAENAPEAISKRIAATQLTPWGAVLGRWPPQLGRNRRAHRLRGGRLQRRTAAASKRSHRHRPGPRLLCGPRRIGLRRVDRPSQYDRPQGTGEGFASLGRHLRAWT